MREEILKIVNQHPKHYIVIIRKNNQLMDWINENTLSTSEHLPTRIYSAIYQLPSSCENGNERNISRWNSGLANCGPANKCDCTRRLLKEKVSISKLSYTEQKKQQIEQKREETMLKKYGVKFNSQREDIKKILSVPKVTEEVFKKLTDYHWLHEEYVTKKRNTVDIANELGIYYSTVASYCIQHGFTMRRKSNYSIIEVEISDFLKENNINFETSNWSVLGNKELDIFIPEKNFAIEVNGLYWHSHHPSFKEVENINKHLEKTLAANAKGIELFHITDYEWINKKEIVKSMLLTKLGKSDKKINARQCEVKQVSMKVAKQFLNNNHLQGHVNSKHYFGLHFKGELVMIMTIGHARFTKENTVFELHRLASKLNIVVVGGASKLLSHVKKILKINNLITYCDRSKSNGNTYYRMGFTLVKETTPGYFWTNGTDIISRYKTMPKNIKKWLPTYDGALSEAQNMFAAGYRRYWDCGNLKFNLIKEQL